MDAIDALLLIAAGLASGFINVMAGGGSLLTLPVFIFLGFPAPMANGSNRVGIVIQSFVAARAFRKAGFSDAKMGLTLALCAMPGAIIGAVSAVKLEEQWFKRILAVIMVLVLLATLWPSKKQPQSPEPSADNPPAPVSHKRRLVAHLAMVGMGFYGGFIQAGAGFLLMPILKRVLRLDLVRVNMYKVTVIALYSLPALAVFVYANQVNWLAGLVLAAGNAAGAIVATRLQIKKGEGPVRVVFALAVVAMAIKLIFSA